MIRSFMILLVFLMAPFSIAQAQDALPRLPQPIQNLVDEGAQIRYLGKDHGLDAWLTIKNGVEQYFYVMPDQKAFVMGVLFDEGGKLVTVQQVDRLRSQGDTLLDTLADFPVEQSAAEDTMAFKSPAEQMFFDIENSNWVGLGRADAPAIYSFIDPQCPHCHAFIQDMMRDKLLENGTVQLRMIPVGFKDETQAQAAFLIASPNPQERWMKHMQGDDTALPAKSEINKQGVMRNLAIMQSWKFDVTPLIIYRANNGEIKIIRGKPQDMNALLRDLG